MIIFTDIGLYGRLGNQMFQLAAMKALALHTNSECYLPTNLDLRVHDGQVCLLNYFDHKIPFAEANTYNNINGTYFQNQMRESVNPNFFNLVGNIELHGHYESEKYFESYKEKIKNLFVLKEPFEKKSEEYIEALRKKYPGKEIVAIHYRRGDALVHIMNPQPIFTFVDYVKNKYFSNENYVFLIFTGGNAEFGNSNIYDMNALKENLSEEKNTEFCEINNTIIEFGIMSKCDHSILTSGSTFAWWASYINKNPEKKIIVPKEPIGLLFFPDALWSKEFIQE